MQKYDSYASSAAIHAELPHLNSFMSSVWEAWPGCGIGSARSENSGAPSDSGAALPRPRPSSRNRSNDSVSNVHGLETARNGAGRQGTAHIYHPQSRKKCMCFCDPPRKFLLLAWDSTYREWLQTDAQRLLGCYPFYCKLAGNS